MHRFLLALAFLALGLPRIAAAQTCEGTYELTSQEAVDSFACTHVEGTLTIRADNGPITSLAGLSELESVTRSFTILLTNDLVTLDGLGSLTSVGDSFSLNDNALLRNVDGLHSLQEVGGLGIYYNDSLENLDGFASLALLDGDAFIQFNPALTSVDGLASVSFRRPGFGIFISDSPLLSECACGLYRLIAAGASINLGSNGSGCSDPVDVMAPAQGQCERNARPAPGDLAIVGFNADDPDAFAFAALSPLAEGTELRFTDNGWQARGGFRASEGTFIYTVPSGGLDPGTVVSVEGPSGVSFSASGDQVLAYVGSEDTPSFLYALNVEGDVWQANATSSNTSALPPGLLNGRTALAVDERDNVTYDGPIMGSRSELLAAISDPENWSGSDSDRQSFPAAFTVLDQGGNVPPFFAHALSDRRVAAESGFIFDYDALDTDGDALTYRLIEAPERASIDAAGRFTWTPTITQADQAFTVTVEASDGQTQVQTTAELTVFNDIPNRPPFFALAPQAGILTGSPVTFEADDPDSNPVTFELTSGPEGATLSTSGELQWTSPPDAFGVYEFVIVASDGTLTASHTFFGGVMGSASISGTLEEAREQLRETYSARTLGSIDARDTLYAVVEADADGFVRGIYTDFAVELPPDVDPSLHLFNNGMNAEHVWPRSLGMGEEPQVSDMYGLYPARASVNSARGNNPYSDIDDDLATAWYYLDQSQSEPPTVDRDLWSEAASGAFEPRESVKGDIARALMYIHSVYEPAIGTAADDFFFDRLVQFALWSLQDPVSPEEVLRTARIAKYQGNINPYLFDEDLWVQAYQISIPNTEADAARGFALSTAHPNPASSTTQFLLEVESTQEVRVDVFDMLGRHVATLHDGLLAAGTARRLSVSVGELSSGLYVCRALGASMIETQRFMVAH
ncbi:MAG: endonuclease [Bacteroidota bacterium]